MLSTKNIEVCVIICYDTILWSAQSSSSSIIVSSRSIPLPAIMSPGPGGKSYTACSKQQYYTVVEHLIYLLNHLNPDDDDIDDDDTIIIRFYILCSTTTIILCISSRASSAFGGMAEFSVKYQSLERPSCKFSK